MIKNLIQILRNVDGGSKRRTVSYNCLSCDNPQSVQFLNVSNVKKQTIFKVCTGCGDITRVDMIREEKDVCDS